MWSGGQVGVGVGSGVAGRALVYFERNYGERFTSLMDKYLPEWRSRNEFLNGAPLAEEAW